MIIMGRFSCPQFLVLVLLFVVSFGTALSSNELAASAQGPGTSQGSQSTVITNFGVAPGVQIANTSFVAAVGSGLTIRFNVTTYEPGTLYWAITNGTVQTAFMSWFQIESGGAILPNGVTATYPDGISSNNNESNVAVILTFASLTAGKTFPLQLDVWLVSQSDPQHPIGVAESITVAVGAHSQKSSLPLTLVGIVGVAAVIVVAMAGLLLYRKKVSVRPAPTAV